MNVRDPDHPDYRGIPAMQQVPGQRAPKSPAPREVTVAFWIWTVGAVLVAVNAVLGLVIYRTQTVSMVVRAMQQNRPAGMDDAQLRGIANTALVIVLVIVLVVVALALFLARRMRTGSAGARIGLTVIAAIVVLLTLISAAGVSALLSVLLPVVATVPMYLPNASAYFQARR